MKRKINAWEMSVEVPAGQGMSGSDSPIVFVGPSASGKTTSLILVHSTCIDYQDDMNIKNYQPLIKSKNFDLYKDTTNLMMNGIPPSPTNASSKDLKVELEILFGGRFRGEKKVRMIFADMAGTISSSLMKVFPELSGMTPDEVKSELVQAGIGEDDVEYLVRNILKAKGLILIADSSQIGGEKDPDAELANYLNNLANYVQSHGSAPKGVALLLTKFDKWSVQHPDPGEDDLKNFVKNHLPQVDNFAKSLNHKAGTKYSVFCSALKETKDKNDNLRFAVEIENRRGKRRVLYSVSEYERLIRWIRDTFSV